MKPKEEWMKDWLLRELAEWTMKNVHPLPFNQKD